MDKVKEQLVLLLSKWWIYLLYIGIGFLGKLSMNFIDGKRMTWWQIAASFGMCMFCGFIATVMCLAYEVSTYKMGCIIPITVYLSEKLMYGIYAINWKQVIVKLVDTFLRK